jgi:hypothetical protein
MPYVTCEESGAVPWASAAPLTRTPRAAGWTTPLLATRSASASSARPVQVGQQALRVVGKLMPDLARTLRLPPRRLDQRPIRGPVESAGETPVRGPKPDRLYRRNRGGDETRHDSVRE